MGTKTSFLELTLPDNGEYVDNWDTVVNANFEDVDDYADELNTELVGSTGDITNLKRSAASLQDRLDAGLNNDGTPNLDTASDFTNLENSKHYGVSSASGQGQRILDRLHFVENDMIACRFGGLSDRYGGTTAPETVSGIARLAGFYDAYGTKLPSGELVPSVIRGFTPNSVVNGPTTSVAPYIASHTSSTGSSDVTVGGNVPTIYNIDGLWFELADEMHFTIGAGGHDSLTPSTKHYLWASRNEADYNASGNLQWYYNEWNGQSLGGTYRINPRIVPTHASLIADAPGSDPTDGSISISTPTVLGSALATNFSLIRAGDILVITSPTSLAGEYLVESAAGTSLTIFGTFPITTSQSGISFHVERRTMPSLGISETATPTAGRIVIGEFTTDVSGEVDVGTTVAYAYNGIHDTGWSSLNDFGWNSAVNHFLGAAPSSMDIWVKNAAPGDSGSVEKDPTLLVEVDAVDTQSGGSGTIKNIRIPALISQCTESTVKVNNVDPNGDGFAYTDYSGLDVSDTSTSHSIRVIVRR